MDIRLALESVKSCFGKVFTEDNNGLRKMMTDLKDTEDRLAEKLTSLRFELDMPPDDIIFNLDPGAEEKLRKELENRQEMMNTIVMTVDELIRLAAKYNQ